MNETKINSVIVQRGNYYMGMKTRRQDGTIAKESPARWEPDAKGTAVAVCAFDSEKKETIDDADLFAAWDSIGIDKHVREKLELKRRNFPTPEELYHWIKKWDERDLDLCEICEGALADYDCTVCPIERIKAEEVKNE